MDHFDTLALGYLAGIASNLLTVNFVLVVDGLFSKGMILLKVNLNCRGIFHVKLLTF